MRISKSISRESQPNSDQGQRKIAVNERRVYPLFTSDSPAGEL